MVVFSMRLLTTLTIAFLLLGTSSVYAQDQQDPPWRVPFPEDRETAEITVGGITVPVDLALTSSQQSLGLGYRNGLDEGSGMLFVFDSAEPRTFWMKGMRFCLDIIWIEGGAITSASDSVCPDPEGTADADRPRQASEGPVTYVLEMDAGWLAANGFGPGTPVEIPDDFQGA